MVLFARLRYRARPFPGKWQQQLQKDCCSNEGRRKLILQNLQLATQLDPQSYKAWHAWALFNQKVCGVHFGLHF